MKREFWVNTEDLLGTILVDEKVFIWRDFNGHIGKEADNYKLVHGYFGYNIKNESRENLLKFLLAKELVIAKSIFRKTSEHFITYKSGEYATQINYYLARKEERNSCLDCKVVLGTKMPT